MHSTHRLTAPSATALIVAAALSGGPAAAGQFTVTGDANHRAVSPAVAPAQLTEAPNHRRLGLTPAPDGSGVTSVDFAVRELDRQGYTDITVLGTGSGSFAAFDTQGREMVIRLDPRRNIITEVVPRREIRARRMAAN